MRMLVLGGSGFVGRQLVRRAIRSGFDVTTFNWDRFAETIPGLTHICGDRRSVADIAFFNEGYWDAVVDTWQGPPEYVRLSARAAYPRVGTYVYISTLMAYKLPAEPPLTERSPTRLLTSFASTYADRKRWAEHYVTESFHEKALILRSGLILGPGDDAFRLAWWLDRLASSETLAPGPFHRQIQFIDVRDLASWISTCIVAGHTGVFNVAQPRGVLTMGDLLTTCSRVIGNRESLTWVDESWLLQQGVIPWKELPLWIPSVSAGAAIYDVDVDMALQSGISFKDPSETALDTWQWMNASGVLGSKQYVHRDQERMSREKANHLLAKWHGDTRTSSRH